MPRSTASSLQDRSESTDPDAPVLSIGAVAAAALVSVAVLRAWEQRFGFPVPARIPSGHRRYSGRQVEQVRQVLRDRDAGLSLEAAIARVRDSDVRPETSMFAALRERHPELAVQTLSRRTMIAISNAIEDECCARAAAPVLIGSFQRIGFYRMSQMRWRDLSRTATATVVMADFPRSRVRKGEPIEIAIKHDSPLLREWAVVCDAPDASACLTGIERVRATRDGPRIWEAVWTVDPAVVRDAARTGLRLAEQYAPRVRGITDRLTLDRVADPRVTADRANALASRVVAYLERRDVRARG